MQRKNLLIWLVASALFVGGLYLLDKHILPRPQPPEKKDETEKLTPEQARARATGLVLGGVGARLVAEAKLKKAVERPEGPKAKAPFWHRLGIAAGPGWAAARGRLPPVRKRLPFLTLGAREDDSPFHLEVQLDPRGASVRQIILNKFKRASQTGRPEEGVLVLIPPDDHLASNVLYHYDVDSPKAERPLDTLGNVDWQYQRFSDEDRQGVRFVTDIQGVRITKTFSLAKRSYHLGLEVKLERVDKTRKDLKFRYQLSGGYGLPLEGRWYTSTFRHCLIGRAEGNSIWRDNQDVREISKKLGGESVSSEEGKLIRYAGIAVQYFASVLVVDDDQENRSFLTSARPTLEAYVVKVEHTGEPILPNADKLVIQDKKDRTKPSETYYLTEKVRNELMDRKIAKGDHFGLLVVPDEKDRQVAVQVLSEAEAQPLFLDDITVRVNTEPVDLGEKDEVTHKYLLYNGPVKPMLLGQMKGAAVVPDELVERYVDTLRLDTLTDYPSSSFTASCFLNWWVSLLIFFTNLMHRVLWWMHSLVPSYGLCIILLTVMVRGLMFPVSRKQAQTSMRMQELGPEMKKVKEKYKDDPRAFQAELMALYRKHGVNPFGSCWLLLLQLPIFMGLYYALQESIHFRLAGFLWMDNLAAPDMLIHWGDGIPLISRPEDYGSFLYLGPYFNLLPVLAVTLMILQQKMMMPPPADEQAAMQQKMMKYMMIFMGLIFYKMPSGLCVYFIASSLWGFAERKLLPKKASRNLPPSASGSGNGPVFAPLAPSSGSAPGGASAIQSPPGISAAQGGKRSKRRQERKRLQERAAQIQGQSSSPGEAPPPRREEANGEGWWAGLRRRLSNWWKDVLKKAAKK